MQACMESTYFKKFAYLGITDGETRYIHIERIDL